MSTNRILEKVDALKNQGEQAPSSAKPPGGGRRGVWSEVETFEDKASGIGVVVTERVRGRPAYSFQIVHFDDHGGNKFVTLPNKGAQRPVEEIVYLLVQKARELIEQKLAESKPRENRPRKGGGKRDGKQGERRDRGPTGLSQLAKQDAQKQGKEFVGKSERKKRKKKSS